jgi:hypothetical protein
VLACSAAEQCKLSTKCSLSLTVSVSDCSCRKGSEEQGEEAATRQASLHSRQQCKDQHLYTPTQSHAVARGLNQITVWHIKGMYNSHTDISFVASQIETCQQLESCRLTSTRLNRKHNKHDSHNPKDTP